MPGTDLAGLLLNQPAGEFRAPARGLDHFSLTIGVFLVALPLMHPVREVGAQTCKKGL